MFRYICSEFLRTIRSKYFLKIVIVIIAVSVLANLTMIAFRDYVYGVNDGTYGYNLIMFAGGFFWLPYYTTIFISDMVLGETYPNPFIKDRITKRLRRSYLYIGKLITAWLDLIIIVILSFIIFIGISTLFQLSTGSLSGAVVVDFAVNILLATPLFAAGCSIGMMCLFMKEKKTGAFLIFWVLTIVIPRCVMLLGAEPLSIEVFKFIKDKILLTPQFTTLQFYASRNVPQILISSTVYIIISTLLGGLTFCRKRIDNLPASAGRKRNE